jgi:hypothetical protein
MPQCMPPRSVDRAKSIEQHQGLRLAGKLRSAISLGCLVLVLSVPVGLSAETDWHYPLEIKVGVSSTFGEFRGNRVHTGVDLKTNMQTGYKVYAIDDGAVVRLCAKKYGFGNAVYIQHPNGLMSVYGHLDRFAEEGLGLQSLVERYRQQRGRKYPGNIYLERPVKRGQLIGYSGETGYGLPHLHFEVRRGGATPIDPFKHGFEYPDTTAPIIESLLIEPLGPHSYVDGEHGIREYRTQAAGAGVYAIEPIPQITGQVRFTAAAYDQIGAENRCAVDRIDLYIAHCSVDQLDLYVDQERLFRNQFNWVTYNTNHRGGLVYDYNWTRLSNPTQYYYRLYNLSPAHFPYREVETLNRGVWDTTACQEGLYTITLETRDVGGNRSRAQMQVYVEHQPTLERAYPPLQDDWRVEIRDFHDFLEIVCQTAVPPQQPPTARITLNGGQPQDVQLTPAGEQIFAGTYSLISGQDGRLQIHVTAATRGGRVLETTRQVPVNTIFARRGGTVTNGDKAAMTLPAGALYEDIFANIFPTTAYETTPGLPLVSDVYDFRPAGCPLEKKGKIRIQYPADAQNIQQLGIYWWDHIKRRWYFMDDAAGSHNSLTAGIIYPSIYAILRDEVRPVIERFIPEPGSTVTAAHRTLAAIITDVGKGVAESSIVMTLDGRRVAGEYDPDRRKYEYTLSGPLAAGAHTLRVQAADRAGHPAQQREATFYVK